MPTAMFRDCAYANSSGSEITAINADDGRRVIFPTDGSHGRHVAAQGLPIAPFSPVVERAMASDLPARLRVGVSAGPVAGAGSWAV